jgi:hypothetical protein
MRRPVQGSNVLNLNCKSTTERKEKEKGPTASLELTTYSPASYYLRLYNQFTMVACTLPVAWAKTQALCPPLPLLVTSQPASNAILALN